MILPPEEAALFFKLYPALHVYVNRQLQVVPEVDSIEAHRRAGSVNIAKIRDAMYSHPELIEQYVAENPDGFSAEELAEVQGWRAFIKGDFYILRYLKKYAIFLQPGKPAHAYGVLGLTDEIEDKILQPPPIYVHTVLLPFKGKVIYDGLIASYPITFGKGMRTDFDDTYQRIKEREGIIETLLVREGGKGGAIPISGKDKRPRKPAPDLSPVIQVVVQEAEKLRQSDFPVQGQAYSLLRAAAHLAQTVAASPEDTDGLFNALRPVEAALTRLRNTLERARWG